jgi:hypothetical protein
MKLFAQIRKVDEANRLVYGRAAQEVVDKADEVMDYESSKPYFQKWSDDVAKDTDGKSLGNVRAMHGKVAAGKLTGIDFNDTEKAIDVIAKVVDDAEWNKVLEGVYTGFSIGGSYIGKPSIEKMDGKDVKRYTASPNEVSLVDRPCIPTATFFEVQKADGTLAKVEFKEPVVEEDAALEVNGTADEVAQLAKLMNESGLSMKDVLAKLAAPAAPEIVITATTPAAPVEKLEGAALRKSMWACAELAQLIACLQNLKSSAVYEAFYEGDVSGIAKRLGAVIALAGQVLVEMIQEEVAEDQAGADTVITVELADQIKGLAKFEGDALMDLLKVGARNSKADADRLAKIHDLSVELGHKCDATKGDPAGDLSKGESLTKADFEKAIADAVAPLQKALDESVERVRKLEAQPAPKRIAIQGRRPRLKTSARKTSLRSKSNPSSMPEGNRIPPPASSKPFTTPVASRSCGR